MPGGGVAARDQRGLRGLWSWTFGATMWRAVVYGVPSLLAALLTFGGTALTTNGFTSASRAGGPLPTGPSAGGRATITYCIQHGTALAMDVYQPPAGAARPAPVAMYVHGGGFLLSTRKPSGLGAGRLVWRQPRRG